MSRLTKDYTRTGLLARPGRGRPKRARRSLARVVALALGATALVPVLGIQSAFAATGEQYLLQATDPHGNIWLPGTTNGLTGGAIDPGTDPTSASYGHLWTTDVPSGFCRIIAATPATDTAAGTAAFLDRTTPGGCITAGGKAGGPDLDPRRNADGTFYLYTPDWAVKSLGVYRLTYDPGSQTMTKSELLAPNRYPGDNKPFDAQLGPLDHKLYVSSDLDGNINRITRVNGLLSQQTVEAGVAKSSDGGRMRAITFACWSALNSKRAAGAPGCSSADPAPDLVMAQKNTVAVVLNAETCQSTVGGCTTLLTPIKVLTPMGLRTDPKNPDVIYVSDSPGSVSQIIRYTISTNIQDSYANFGVLDDGSSSQLAFAFDVGFGPDHAMYIGDDPTAGSTAFSGRYFRVAPNAPADALGQPGVAATPPTPPSLQTGSRYGAGVTLPADGVWMGTHLWIPDSVNGLCRMDPTLDAVGNPVPGGMAENLTTCKFGANAAGLLKAEQSAFDAAKNLLYVADGGSKSVGVVRFVFDPTTETLSTPSVLAAGLVGTGLGLDGQRADAVALDPVAGSLYVGFRTRNLGVSAQIARVNNPSAADTTSQAVEFVANTTRSTPVFGLGFIVNPASGGVPATSDLYIGDNKGVDLLTNVATCAAGGCSPILALGIRGPKGLASDGSDNLYLASPPAPGTAGTSTTVQRYTVSTGSLFAYSSVGINPDATQQPYGFVFSLALDPAGNLYVADNPNVLAPPNGLGHVWKVSVPTGIPAQPSITSKPNNPTNATTPSFAFRSLTAGATYECSLVATGALDNFSACTSPFTAATVLADGPYTFKVRAVNASGTSAPAIYSFTVDTIAPVMTITTPPASPTKNSSPSFTFTSSKPVSAQCALTTAPPVVSDFVPCSSPQSYAAQPDGAYTFTLKGTDLAGNASNVATAPLTIDTVAPVVSFSPPGGAYVTTQSVTLSTNEPATMFFTTDGTAPTPLSTSYAGPITIAGTSTLKVIAVDTAGNQSAVASQVYTIGAVVLGGKPVSPSADPSPGFTFSAPSAPGATFQCALTAVAPAAADFTTCTSPKTYPGLADGTWTFTVQGSDPSTAPATDLGTATATFTQDAAAPVLTSNPANPSVTSTETFAFSKAEPGWTFQCSLVTLGAPNGLLPCTSPKSYPNTADGSYTFAVQAFDANGMGSATKSYSFGVNAGTTASTATAPVQQLVVPSTASTTTVPVSLTWSGSTNATGYELQQSINGGSFFDVAGCTSTAPCAATTAVLGDRPSATNQSTVTTYRYQVRAVNATGVFGAYAVGPTFSIPATDNTAGFSFNGSWSGVNLSGAYNGSVQQSGTVGAFAQNSSPLGGTRIGFVSTKGPDRGVAQLVLDGNVVGTVDLYSPTLQPAQVVWSSADLGAVGHTLRVVVAGAKNASSSGIKVDVDAYVALK